MSTKSRTNLVSGMVWNFMLKLTKMQKSTNGIDKEEL